ncbi:MAG: DMT family transporter, partial [Chitinophagaceae bacterium]
HMNQPNGKWTHWLLFLALSVTWGSSFILMKRGLYSSEGQPTLNAFEVAALRLLSAGVFMLPFALRNFRMVSRKALGYITICGVIGTFIPAFLFCVAETRIDSNLAGFLNSFTPISTLLIGGLFFRLRFAPQKYIGVLVAFLGMALLFWAHPHSSSKDLYYSLLVLAATLCYGLNVNIGSHHLREVPALQIAALAFSLLILPSLLVLQFSGFFSHTPDREYWISISASMLLGVLGTAIASIWFYRLMKVAGPLFSSMVTYGIPFVALAWGVYYQETIYGLQVAGLAIILAGVYTASK